MKTTNKRREILKAKAALPFAGAIRPANAFQWAFEQGADYICVGMFDFQMIANVNLAQEVPQGSIPRNRPWC